jgi:sec-independent protein translocase protein TatC
MAKALAPISHEDRLSLVEHLDELRSRLIISLIAIAVAFGVCFWQNKRLLNFLAAPVKRVLSHEAKKGQGPEGQATQTSKAVIALGHAISNYARTVAGSRSGAGSAIRAGAAVLQHQVTHALAGVHVASGDNLTTLGVGEPFTISVTVCMYFSVLIAMPVILYQLYAFVLPAFSPREQAVALPIMLAVPGLLVGGAAFGYYIVLPAATHFLLGFNASQFNVIVQASSYYPFAALIMVAMGLIFQVPILLVALTRAQIITTRQLRKNRRIAIAVAAVIAALLPGDAITMLLETVPLIVLYELSIHISAILDLRDRRRARASSQAAVVSAAAAGPAPTSSAPPPPRPLRDDDAV